jgi:glycosyltransferase involved in cell wall biosynthesis
MARIVIDARESGTSTGRYIDKLVEYLHALEPGHEIIVLSKSGRVEHLKKAAPNFKVVKSNFKEFTFSEQIGLLWQLRGLKADLVHFPMPQQPILYSGKAVTSILDLTTTRFRNPAKNWLVFTLKQAVYRLVIKRVARKSVEVIAISQFAKRDVAQYCNIPLSKIAVTYPAADKIGAKSQPVGSLENKEFILCVGRALPHKNLKRLVDAFSIIRQSRSSLLLVFVGRLDKNYQLLQSYTNRRAIGGIIFTDHISDGGLRWLYEHTQAYVFPSLSEGFGLPGLEAMVHGSPVVSSNTTCLPEIYGNAAHYFDPLDVRDMAAKISAVIDNESLRSQFIKKGKAQAAKYSWPRLAGQTLDIYEKALKD